MPRFLCTVYTYSTGLRFVITYTHFFGTDKLHDVSTPWVNRESTKTLMQ